MIQCSHMPKQSMVKNSLAAIIRRFAPAGHWRKSSVALKFSQLDFAKLDLVQEVVEKDAYDRLQGI